MMCVCARGKRTNETHQQTFLYVEHITIEWRVLKYPHVCVKTRRTYYGSNSNGQKQEGKKIKTEKSIIFLREHVYSTMNP